MDVCLCLILLPVLSRSTLFCVYVCVCFFRACDVFGPEAVLRCVPSGRSVRNGDSYREVQEVGALMCHNFQGKFAPSPLLFYFILTGSKKQQLLTLSTVQVMRRIFSTVL